MLARRPLAYLTLCLALFVGDGPGTVCAQTQDPAPRTARFGRAILLEETSETSANASLGDLDADGDLDIVLAKGRHWPLIDWVLLNDGLGAFARRPVGGDADRTYTAALSDLDRDGDLDLVVGNDQPDPKLVYLNDGSGAFAPAASFGDAAWPTRNVTVADVTGDGFPDIIVANRGGEPRGTSNQICVNDGHANFPTCHALSSESATTIAAGDLNGDGFVDLVVPHRDGGQSYIYLNDGRGGFAERVAFGPAEAATRAIALGDVNGDGTLDLVVGDGEAGGAVIHLNDGSGHVGAAQRLGSLREDVYSIAIADLDGDGAADVVTGHVEAPSAVFFNRGAGSSWESHRIGDDKGSVYGLAIGDVNGDGRPDIVAGRSGAPNVLYIN